MSTWVDWGCAFVSFVSGAVTVWRHDFEHLWQREREKEERAYCRQLEREAEECAAMAEEEGRKAMLEEACGGGVRYFTKEECLQLAAMMEATGMHSRDIWGRAKSGSDNSLIIDCDRDVTEYASLTVHGITKAHGE